MDGVEHRGLGLVGTRELEKKICRCTLYAHPPSPSLLSLLPVCSCHCGCGWLWGHWGGEGQQCANTKNTSIRACLSCLKGGWGSKECAKHKKHV